jgi:dihydroorotate dehydrogenase (fumarate)/dihydroorotate dehydrogenase
MAHAAAGSLGRPESAVSLYLRLLRPLLFSLDAETAHHLTVEICRVGAAIPGVKSLARLCLETSHPMLQCDVAGLHFANPLGLAAGWDKSGRALRMLDALGFGFVEIGSVSARPSLGNPRPRLFRLPAQQAILVNYGLPNDGAEVVAQRLAACRPRCPLGVNIVKTNDGPDAPACSPDELIADYVQSVRRLAPHADYLMLNLSCPNAACGQDFFAQPGAIRRLLAQLAPLGLELPVFLKVAPYDDPDQQERLLMECEGFDFLRGFCVNLPPRKAGLGAMASVPEMLKDQPGALAGKPVEALINRCIAGLYARIDKRRYILIGAGGVFSAEDAYLKLQLGASLVQIYTALIYHGPGLVKRICRGLVALMERDGVASIADVVGSAHDRTTLSTLWSMP